MSLPDADVLYVALIGDRSRLNDARRLTYRCDERRCLLLDAIEISDAVLLHQKRFKNSPEVNLRRSSEAGRRRNTVDGKNHWKSRSFYLSDSALAYPNSVPLGQLSLQCDHVGVGPDSDYLTLGADAFERDWRKGHAEVLVRADGTLCAVR